MGSKKISQLNQVSTINDADEFVVEQSDETRRLTMRQLRSLMAFNHFVEDRVPFVYSYYRNKEKDNNLATDEMTPITVTSAPSGGSCTLANVPYDPSIINPESGKEWQIRPSDGAYSNSYYITGGNLSTGVFTVAAAGSSPSLVNGEEVILINPFRVVEWLSTDYMIEANTSIPGSGTELTASSIFRHSDGTYRWLFHTTGDGIGYATASALEGPWTWSASTFPIVVPTDIDAGYSKVRTGGSMVWLPEEERYAQLLMIDDTADSYVRHFVLWKYDEDFTNMEFLDPLLTIPTGGGMATGAICNFKNKWFIFFTYRNAATGPYDGVWEFQYATADNLDGDWGTPVVVVEGLTKGTGTATDFDSSSSIEDEKNGQYYAGWIDYYDPFIYNGRLYVLIAGTSYWSETGFALDDSGTTSNRQIGLWYYDEFADEFKPDPRGAVIINPQDANSLTLWNSYNNLWDHMGTGGGLFVDDDGEVYYAVTVNGYTASTGGTGTPLYGGVILKLNI